jgi:hypothetical protein
MNDHPTELLLAAADGQVPPPAARAHLAACDHCQRVLAALVDVDLARVWAGVTAELCAPRPSPLERLALRVGIDPSLARFAALTPSLAWSWLLASAAVIALGIGLQVLGEANPSSPAVVVAPLVAAALVAFAYGPAVDPAYEVVATTPLSPARALLTRLAVVLTVNAVLVAALDLLIRRQGFQLGWLLPMAAVALLAAVVAAHTQPLVGAVAGAGAWVVLLVAGYARHVPVQAVSSSWAQLAFAATVALLGWWLVRAARGGWTSGLPAG